MFFPEGQVRVHLCGQPVDMRKSYDGLYALTRNTLHRDPLSGHLFVFIAVISETGSDMSRFTTVGHFTSWLGLCPGSKITGGKVMGRVSVPF